MYPVGCGTMLRTIRFPAMLGACVITALSVSCGALLAQQSGQQIYKSVDDKGRVIFTDTRPKDRPSEAVKVAVPNTAAAVETKVDAAGKTAAGRGAATVAYTVFSITSPTNNEALDFNITAVNVSVTVEPALQDGHVVQFYLDGQSVGKPGSALSRQLTDLERGAHTVEARLRDKRGKMLMSTGLVHFFVRRSGDLQNPGNSGDWEDDYPYNQRGFRGPRGAGSAGGASEPGGASGDIGAGSAEGAPSPWDPAVPVRPIRHRR